MSAQRYVVECVWGGYRSSQSRPCHRRVLPKKRAEKFATIQAVQFTDNTTMTVTVREAEPREKVKEIRGYDDLLQRFLDRGMTGYVRVADLFDGGSDGA